jgi:hypothetical protein
MLDDCNGIYDCDCIMCLYNRIYGTPFHSTIMHEYYDRNNPKNQEEMYDI